MHIGMYFQFSTKIYNLVTVISYVYFILSHVCAYLSKYLHCNKGLQVISALEQKSANNDPQGKTNFLLCGPQAKNIVYIFEAL